MKLILSFFCVALLLSCSQTYVWTFSDFETGSPMAGVAISEDSSSSVHFTDSSGKFQTSIPNKFKNKALFLASHSGYYDTPFKTSSRKDISLFPLVNINVNSNHGNPFYDLDSLSEIEICKRPDTFAIIVGGLDSLVQLLRNVGLVSERNISNYNFNVQVHFLIDKHGNSNQMKINVAPPIKAFIDVSSAISPAELRSQDMQQTITDFFESIDLKWVPASKNGENVYSQFSFWFRTP